MPEDLRATRLFDLMEELVNEGEQSLELRPATGRQTACRPQVLPEHGIVNPLNGVGKFILVGTFVQQQGQQKLSGFTSQRVSPWLFSQFRTRSRSSATIA